MIIVVNKYRKSKSRFMNYAECKQRHDTCNHVSDVNKSVQTRYSYNGYSTFKPRIAYILHNLINKMNTGMSS